MYEICHIYSAIFHTSNFLFINTNFHVKTFVVFGTEPWILWNISLITNFSHTQYALMFSYVLYINCRYSRKVLTNLVNHKHYNSPNKTIKIVVTINKLLANLFVCQTFSAKSPSICFNAAESYCRQFFLLYSTTMTVLNRLYLLLGTYMVGWCL